MRLVTYSTEGNERLGAFIDGDSRIVDLPRAANDDPAFPRNMQALIEGGEVTLDAARQVMAAARASDIVETSRVHLLAPIPRPIKMRDCQLFQEHVDACLDRIARDAAAMAPDPRARYAEMVAAGMTRSKPITRERVVYYNCDRLGIAGPFDDIHWPRDSQWIDYEVEWAVVIGKTGQDIGRADAPAHIFGYTVFNDLSMRDILGAAIQTGLGPPLGKDFDQGTILGPCIVTADELPDPYDLAMIARVNGVERSRGSTGSMHFRFDEAIEILSRGRTLYAGEILGSGTVGGGCSFELEEEVRRGDLVEIEIERIGTLRNRILP